MKEFAVPENQTYPIGSANDIVEALEKYDKEGCILNFYLFSRRLYEIAKRNNYFDRLPQHVKERITSFKRCYGVVRKNEPRRKNNRNFEEDTFLKTNKKRYRYREREEDS